MTALEAIEDSIKHWEENLKAEAPYAARITSSACACCKRSSNIYKDIRKREGIEYNSCLDCPVALYAKNAYCYGTPWRSVADAKSAWTYSNIEEYKIKYQKACQKEIDFLKEVKQALIEGKIVPQYK